MIYPHLISQIKKQKSPQHNFALHIFKFLCVAVVFREKDLCSFDPLRLVVQAFEFELRREYTEHYLCKQVLRLTAPFHCVFVF